MSTVSITCPHCGHTREVDRSRIPPNVRSATCRACEKSFPFTPASMEGASAEEPAASPSASRRIPFLFTGNAREYFGIWIVNTLLKIVTLGLYSPWAKVRKRRYFYGNTLLDGANFDYLADPFTLLKGWLLGAALFICYSVGSNYSPMIGIGLGLVFFLLLPWVIVRSRVFNTRNSAHRNIRFNFRPAYREAYTAFAWLPALTPFTAGLLAPYAHFRQKRFLMENNLFGTSSFTFDAEPKAFYLIGLKTVGLGILLVGGVGVFTGILASGLPQTGPMFPAAMGALMPVAMVTGYPLVGIYAYVRTTNLTWSSTSLGRHRLESAMRVRDVAWILSSNAVAIAASFGLLIPWASVRFARYRLGKLSLLASGDLAAFQAGLAADTSAMGEEIGDIFDIDIGI